MEFLLDPGIWIGLLTLIVLERGGSGNLNNTYK